MNADTPPAAAPPTPTAAPNAAPSAKISARERLSLSSALFMIGAGVAMSVAGFVCDPMGEISDSVLWFTAQALVYAGSIFGVSIYVQQKLGEIMGELRR